MPGEGEEEIIETAKAWQNFRSSLLYTGLEHKRKSLWLWLLEHHFDRASQVQVSNYINALKRGGLLK